MSQTWDLGEEETTEEGHGAKEPQVAARVGRRAGLTWSHRGPESPGRAGREVPVANAPTSSHSSPNITA